MNNLKWKAKNDTCGVPGKGYIKAEDLTQKDIDNLKERAKNRKKDFHTFMLQAGFVPSEPQLEIELEEAAEEPLTTVDETVATLKPEKQKRKRRTKEEIAAEAGEGEE
jgi:hypothetical protein